VFGRGLLGRLDLALRRQVLRRDAHLVLRIGDDAAERARGRQRHLALGAPLAQHRVQFARPQVRRLNAQPAHLGQQLRRLATPARSLRRAALARQAGDAALSVRRLPPFRHALSMLPDWVMLS